ncbi:MAG: DUF1501 domain-containing protein [Paracoccaceae bacterium]
MADAIIGRRGVLTGLMGCSIAASPLVTPITLAAAPFDARLVVILLRGGLDGLDAIRPAGDPDFAALRETLSVPGERAGDFWDIHPALSPLMPLWRAGQMGAIHAVSTPYRDRRSHFDGQDLLEAGVPTIDGGWSDGWLNRMLQVVPGIEPRTAYDVGQGGSIILSGTAPHGSWSPDQRLTLSPQAERLLDTVMHDDPLFRDAAAEAVDIARAVAAAGEAGDDAALAQAAQGSGLDLRGRHVEIARFTAARLREETRIAAFSINGWDTHSRQDRGIARALGNLSETILALRAASGPQVWDRTAVLCMTEFGRTARENGSRGTDHGTGGAMLFAGGAMRGGRVVTDWPGLAEADLYAGRDLMPTRDLRAHAGWVMRGLFGLGRAQVQDAVFPGVDLGTDPGLLS